MTANFLPWRTFFFFTKYRKCKYKRLFISFEMPNNFSSTEMPDKSSAGSFSLPVLAKEQIIAGPESFSRNWSVS